MRKSGRLIGKWTLAWVIGGAIVGVLMLASRTPVIAESGAGQFWAYLAWLPIGVVAGVVLGVPVAVIFTILINLSQGLGSLTVRVRSIACGAMAGAIGGAAAAAIADEIPNVLLSAALFATLGALTGLWMTRYLRGPERRT